MSKDKVVKYLTEMQNGLDPDNDGNNRSLVSRSLSILSLVEASAFLPFPEPTPAPAVPDPVAPTPAPAVPDPVTPAAAPNMGSIPVPPGMATK